LLERQWRQAGFTTVRIDLSEISGENLLVHVDEQGVGIDLELLDGEGKVVARSGSPVDRSASEWAYVSVGNRSAKILLIKARDARTFEAQCT
jgi:hypothetical protein